jgi:hypothetical protein
MGASINFWSSMEDGGQRIVAKKRGQGVCIAEKQHHVIYGLSERNKIS